MNRIIITAQTRVDGGWTIEALLGGQVQNRAIVEEKDGLDVGEVRLAAKTIRQCAKALSISIEAGPYCDILSLIDHEEIANIEDFHVLGKQQKSQFKLLQAAINWMQTFTQKVKAAKEHENQVVRV